MRRELLTKRFKRTEFCENMRKWDKVADFGKFYFRKRPGMFLHAVNPSSWGIPQEDLEDVIIMTETHLIKEVVASDVDVIGTTTHKEWTRAGIAYRAMYSLATEGIRTTNPTRFGQIRLDLFQSVLVELWDGELISKQRDKDNSKPLVNVYFAVARQAVERAIYKENPSRFVKAPNTKISTPRARVDHVDGKTTVYMPSEPTSIVYNNIDFLADTTLYRGSNGAMEMVDSPTSMLESLDSQEQLLLVVTATVELLEAKDRKVARQLVLGRIQSRDLAPKQRARVTQAIRTAVGELAELLG